MHSSILKENIIHTLTFKLFFITSLAALNKDTTVLIKFKKTSLGGHDTRPRSLEPQCVNQKYYKVVNFDFYSAYSYANNKRPLKSPARRDFPGIACSLHSLQRTLYLYRFFHIIPQFKGELIPLVLKA